jgi:hypothetical protein
MFYSLHVSIFIVDCLLFIFQIGNRTFGDVLCILSFPDGSRVRSCECGRIHEGVIPFLSPRVSDPANARSYDVQSVRLQVVQSSVHLFFC